MKKILSSSILTAVLLLVLITPVMAQPAPAIHPEGPDPAFEQPVLDRLEKINPEAVPLFVEGTKALYEDDNYELARQKFEEVLGLAPNFPDAVRRLGHALTGLEKYEAAVVQYQKAFDLEPSPPNKNALANGLLNLKIPEKDMQAYNLAKEALQVDQSEVNFFSTAIYAAFRVNEMEFARTNTASMLEKFPDEWRAHYLASFLYMTDSKWEEADNQLQTAKSLGAPEEDIAEIYADKEISTQFMIARGIRWGLYGLAAWITLLGILFLAGVSLSNLTIRTVKNQAQSGISTVSPAEKFIRRIYQGVIGIASAYFYVSIPILILVVMLSVGLVAYLFLIIGHIPIRLALIILVVATFTLVAIVRSIFVRPSKGDPGKSLEKSEAPELWRLLTEIASRLSTKPIEKVFITPDTSIAVYERGNWLKKLNRKGERCLLLGLGALPDMTQGEFQAIIAHEYGHFINADTAGGTIANRVRLNIYTMARSLAQSGAATWYNPVWWFVNGFNRIFIRITHGASRLQEIQADRLAASQYGVGNFKTGLEHIIRQSIQFNYLLDQEVKLAMANSTGLQNLYTVKSIDKMGEMETEIRKALSEPTSPYDSHPSPMERFDLIRQVIGRGNSMEDNRLMWELIPGSAPLQLEMTNNLETILIRKGILPVR
jgi:Zn-dependent protease with chaperone function